MSKKYGTLAELREIIQKAWYYRKCGTLFREHIWEQISKIERVCTHCGRKEWRYLTAKELMNQ